ncbi:MAG: putative ABC transport system permease protein [Oceanospirillaceae bacterium]|jgi:putative ABC transport system permease protein
MFKLAARLAWRDWRGGELSLLFVALILAITSVTSISLFTHQVKQSMVAQGADLIAADLRLNSSQPAPELWLAKAQALSLQQAQVSQFQAMVFADQGMQLARIKAVSKNYPLRGEISVGNAAFVLGNAIKHGPKQGEIWPDSRLLASLNATLKDTIDVGQLSLTITKILISAPDQASGFSSFAPTAMINLNDLEATEAVQTGSRVTHLWLLAGPTSALNSLKKRLSPLLTSNHKWQSPTDGNANMAATLDKAEQFLLLAGSLAVVLAGVALSLSARRYSLRQAKHVALLKCLGLKPNQLRLLYLSQMILLALLALLISLPLAWGLYQGLLLLVTDYIQASSMIPPLAPFILGTATGTLCLLAFVLPPMLALAKVAPAEVLRQSSSQSKTNIGHLTIGFSAVIALVYWHSQSLLISSALIIGVAIILILLALIANLLIKLGNRLRPYLGQGGKIGLANLSRRKHQNSLQVAIFGLALMLLFSLISVRSFLIEDWQQQLKKDTPNLFLFNIYQQQRDSLIDSMEQQGLTTKALTFFPIARARLTDPKVDNPRGDRELNLTWSQSLPAGNSISAGQWWDHANENAGASQLEVSVELDYAQDIGLTLGQSLTFNVAGIQHKAILSNLRKVDWSSMQPNFFFVFSQPLVEANSASYMASVYIAPQDRSKLGPLLRQQPTISMLDVDQILQQVQRVVAQLSLAVESILVMVLGAGILVLVASIQASIDERRHESAILRTLGASKALIRSILLVEYASLGFVAGFIAGVSAEALVAVLQNQLFQMPLQFHWPLWVLTPFTGMLIIGACGWWFNRTVVTSPPLRTLRQS